MSTRIINYFMYIYVSKPTSTFQNNNYNIENVAINSCMYSILHVQYYYSENPLMWPPLGHGKLVVLMECLY